MPPYWTFDAAGRDLTIHASVKQVGGTCRVLWLVNNRTGAMVDDGATSRLSPAGALIHLRAVAETFGIEGADVDLCVVKAEDDLPAVSGSG